MVSTLSYVDHLLARAENLDKRGLLAQACDCYERLLKIRPMERKRTASIAGKLGKLFLERGLFARARKHLTLAATRLPDHAEYQILLAQAIEADETCEPDRAEVFYRRGVKLQPDNADYLLDLATHLADAGDQEALDLLRRAQKLGQNDPDTLGRIAEGLRDLGKLEEAQDVLRLIRFRHARTGRFPQFWNAHQFQSLWARQQQAFQTKPVEETPILRFVQAAG